MWSKYSVILGLSGCLNGIVPGMELGMHASRRATGTSPNLLSLDFFLWERIVIWVGTLHELYWMGICYLSTGPFFD